MPDEIVLAMNTSRVVGLRVQYISCFGIDIFRTPYLLPNFSTTSMHIRPSSSRGEGILTAPRRRSPHKQLAISCAYRSANHADDSCQLTHQGILLTTGQTDCRRTRSRSNWRATTCGPLSLAHKARCSAEDIDGDAANENVLLP